MANKAVIGLGFGDEGKGNITNYLCSQSLDPVVIRHNGGHQAGHNVVHKGIQHIFANYGSGSLQGAETYWSKFCTADPIGLVNELAVLLKKTPDYLPVVNIDPEAMVITPFDVASNIDPHDHGTCGVGFGETIARNERGYKLFFQDLYYPSVLKMKLDLIAKDHMTRWDREVYVNEFMGAVATITNSYSVTCKRFNELEQPVNIFEGAQGLLLDQNYGFFPHVTRSNTGTKNVRALGHYLDEVYYVTRAYQTRHGNGPMTGNPFKVLNVGETNFSGGMQGVFRITPLDLDLLVYALDCDRLDAGKATTYVVITCIDQMGTFEYSLGGIPYIFSNEILFGKAIKKILPVDNVYLCESAECKELIKI